MDDHQLDNLLKKVKVPKRSKKYEAEFPKKVISAIRQRPKMAQSQTGTEFKRLRR